MSAYVTLGTAVRVQMFRSSGQSDAKSPVFSFEASLVPKRVKLSRPWPARESSLGPVARKRDTLPLKHWDIIDVLDIHPV
ncbi:hypothetical protein TNCV_4875991 [Trichonephila clavipes]|uniref:Uncharacterized protein n=1 Tax=Trichonephila clavipes TaxID=2585209 RepID=A0A8X6RPB5_TRICX|nr:hypothetical protein TNCV_4875991 [Trichonephila clavipes]